MTHRGNKSHMVPGRGAHRELLCVRASAWAQASENGEPMTGLNGVKMAEGRGLTRRRL